MNNNKSNSLGARSLYYCEEDMLRYKNISNVIERTDKKNYIEPSSVLSIMMKNYIVGDNTLIQGIKKEPWMHYFDEDTKKFTPNDLPKHGGLVLDDENVALRFKELLLDEAREFIKEKNTIGILLSGGMDSRIVAGIIRELQKTGEFNGDVVALTWGEPVTRDVVYAKEIVEKFSWEHIHYPLTAEVLSENIYLTADMGAEFSPLHLHAMHQISKEKNLDGILAGSYGDSVGRAEFSGKKVTDISGLLSTDFNKFGLLSYFVKKDNSKKLELEIQKYHHLFSRTSDWQHYEIERQCHYMRRQLGACMDIIDDKTPIYQMFTAPSVFGFIWSLDPICRTDTIYSELLKLLPGELFKIPWARDGKIYPGIGFKLDNIPSEHNQYGLWLRTECLDVVNSALNNGALERLNLFNPYALDAWKTKWMKSKELTADRLDERISWMASLAIFADKYKIGATNETPDNTLINDYFGAKRGELYGLVYRGVKPIVKKIRS